MKSRGFVCWILFSGDVVQVRETNIGVWWRAGRLGVGGWVRVIMFVSLLQEEQTFN